MRCADIVAQLQRRLPLLTADFSDTVPISSIVHAGTIATVTTATAHGLVAGHAVTIFGARTPVPVASITHAALADYAVVTTSEDHDLTLYRYFTDGNVVEVDGAVEAEFEGVRTVVAVPNRRTLHITVDPAAPAAATGTIRLLGASNYFRNVRGLYAVATVVSPTVFTLSHTAASDLGTLVGPAFLRTPPRITGAINEAAAQKSYSEEVAGGPAKPWAFVVLRDPIVSREKDVPVDIVGSNTLSGGWRQIVQQPFSVYVALPTVADERGRSARDRAEDLLAPMLRALLGAEFPTGFARERPTTAVNFVGHAAQAGLPGPYYVHAYDFEQSAALGLADTVMNDEHVAFRDIALDLSFNLGTEHVAAAIDLDDEPVP